LPSGAYIFKPMMDDQDSHPYSALLSYSVIKEGPVAAAMLFNFDKSVDGVGSDSETYQVLVRLVDDSLSMLEFEVLMLGIPVAQQQGQEVVAKWRVLDLEFKNDGTFYTDSNGLEMQKRVLNFRETYSLDTDMKVSANYYPINSAISIKSSESKNLR